LRDGDPTYLKQHHHNNNNDHHRLHRVLPPTLALHSFTGKAETARQLLQLPEVGRKIYFGFSVAINLRPARNGHPPPDAGLRQVLQAIPRDRVLLESDQNRARPVNHELQIMCEFLADVWGTSVKEAAAITAENAERWLGGGGRKKM